MLSMPINLKFAEFPKIPRLNRDCTITEKIDGTNASVVIALPGVLMPIDDIIAEHSDGSLMFAGSRTRYIVPNEQRKGSDNHGFAAWVRDHASLLWTLGPGNHYGEWWGSGIQRGYGLPKGEKRFSLFNTHRWGDDDNGFSLRPACCSIVPTLYQGPFSTISVDTQIESLRLNGSWAARGFMQPEGIVIYHTALGGYFKATLEKDEQPKGLNR